MVAALLKCTYCAVAHGGLMVKSGKATADQVSALACNYHDAGLSAADARGACWSGARAGPAGAGSGSSASTESTS